MVGYSREQLDGLPSPRTAGYRARFTLRKTAVLFCDVGAPSPYDRRLVPLRPVTNQAAPMKGMLTGPVTILQCPSCATTEPAANLHASRPRSSRRSPDLEPPHRHDSGRRAGHREGSPPPDRVGNVYLRWAVDSFRLATSAVRDGPRSHSHNVLLRVRRHPPAVAEMDADGCPSKLRDPRWSSCSDFGRFAYPNEVGPGVYDIHSPRVPRAIEMLDLLPVPLALPWAALGQSRTAV